MSVDRERRVLIVPGRPEQGHREWVGRYSLLIAKFEAQGVVPEIIPELQIVPLLLDGLLIVSFPDSFRVNDAFAVIDSEFILAIESSKGKLLANESISAVWLESGT